MKVLHPLGSCTVKPVLSNPLFKDIAFDMWLLINESSVESSCIGFLHYFHAAISNHLSEKPKICLVLYGCETQV